MLPMELVLVVVIRIGVDVLIMRCASTNTIFHLILVFSVFIRSVRVPMSILFQNHQMFLFIKRARKQEYRDENSFFFNLSVFRWFCTRSYFVSLHHSTNYSNKSTHIRVPDSNENTFCRRRSEIKNENEKHKRTKEEE